MLRLIGTVTYEIKFVFDDEINIKIHERKQYFKSDKKILEPDNLSWFIEKKDKEEIYLRVDSPERGGFIEWYVCYDTDLNYNWSAYIGYDKRLEEEYELSLSSINREKKLERILL